VVLKEEYRRRLLGKANIFERIVTNRVQLYGLVYKGRNYVYFAKVLGNQLSPWLVYPILLCFIAGMGYQGVAILWRAWRGATSHNNNGTHSV
jgi:hypothetical protein